MDPKQPADGVGLFGATIEALRVRDGGSWFYGMRGDAYPSDWSPEIEEERDVDGIRTGWFQYWLTVPGAPPRLIGRINERHVLEVAYRYRAPKGSEP